MALSSFCPISWLARKKSVFLWTALSLLVFYLPRKYFIYHFMCFPVQWLVTPLNMLGDGNMALLPPITSGLLHNTERNELFLCKRWNKSVAVVSHASSVLLCWSRRQDLDHFFTCTSILGINIFSCRKHRFSVQMHSSLLVGRAICLTEKIKMRKLRLSSWLLLIPIAVEFWEENY